MDVPLGLLIAAAGTGWAIVGWAVRMVFRGGLITPREANAKDAEITALRKDNQELLKQNGVLLNSALPTIVEFLGALRKVAESGDKS